MLIRLRDKATRCYCLVMDPRGFPTNLPEFQRVFPDNDACAKYL